MTQQETHTEGWQTYINSEFYYQLQYPNIPSVVVATSTNGGNDGWRPYLQKFDITFSGSPNSSAHDNDEFDLSVEVLSNPKGLTTKQWAELWVGIQNENEVEISGLDGYKVGVFGGDEEDEYIYFTHRALIYQIYYPALCR